MYCHWSSIRHFLQYLKNFPVKLLDIQIINNEFEVKKYLEISQKMVKN